MEGVQHEDPFLWSVQQVADALCKPELPWCQRQTPEALAETIRDEELDGQTLLTFEFSWDGGQAQLTESLGIKPMRHRKAFADLIVDLRDKSQGFWPWKTEYTRRKSHGPGDELRISPELRSKLELEPKPQISDTPPPVPPAEAVEEGPSPTPTLKRKRVAPTLLQGQPTGAHSGPIPTEADAWLRNQYPWEASDSHQYLGPGKLSSKEILSSRSELSSDIFDLPNDEFYVQRTKVMPRGRTLVSYRNIKKLLVKNSRTEANVRKGYATKAPSESDSDEEVLDLLNLPDEHDEMTLKEIELERQEMVQAQRDQLESLLSTAQVETALADAIAEIKAYWTDFKLPKLQRKAYGIWKDATKFGGTRKIKILHLQTEAARYEDRIHKLRQNILEQKWTAEDDVKQQARCIEQSLHDKWRSLWTVGILESRFAPERPKRLPKLKPRPAKRPNKTLDEELLTSSDEDDFVVPDDDREDAELPPLLQDSPPVDTPSQPRIEIVDLTQIETPEKPRDRQALDSAPSGQLDSSPPLSRGFEEVDTWRRPTIESTATVEEIGRQTNRHWIKNQERWKLLVKILWDFKQTRRGAIFKAVREIEPDDIWQATVGRQLADPWEDATLDGIPPERRISFDMTQLFYCCLTLRRTSNSRIANLAPRHKQKLQDYRATQFPKFCDFLKQIAPLFPVDSQVYAAEPVSDGDENDEGLNSQRRPHREIVQNKEALDMRVRETERMAEQQLRREKLRAKLANSGEIPSDKSRLIINETKDENQSFIYVNDEIGKLIKDHQIEGVRFLWNQVVANPTDRQGCLLAHTMGLGKTMQVITLLVALKEAAASTDESIRAQIPEDLRRCRTLVLCPPGLVKNWMDEILTWAPDTELLGTLRSIESTLAAPAREAEIKDWAEGTGVLIIGYDSFRALSKPNTEIAKLFAESPDIVITDEAHKLKNPESGISQAAAQFKTGSRIALTGSPLANNVEEYHTMIDWVAPNFLGPLAEFRGIYATPILQGLYSDSLPGDRKMALKMLQVLKETVAPKIHRATITSTPSLKSDFPPKREFVIFLSPTELQQKLYNLYIKGISGGERMNSVGILSAVSDLTLICNHPRAYREKLDEMQKKVRNKEQTSHFPTSMLAEALKATCVKDPIAASLSHKTEFLMTILRDAAACGDKVLIFTHSIPTMTYLDYLLQAGRVEYFKLNGTTPIKSRQESVKKFNEGKALAYLISTTAGGVGLNIHGANRVVIFDEKWNPTHEQQAIGRAYRIGQKKPVFVYRLLIAGSVEAELQNKGVFKTQLFSRVVDKKNPVSNAKKSLSSIIHPLYSVDPKDLSSFGGQDHILDHLIESQRDRVIRSIVSSDTFEEEDPTAELTLEERNEAQRLAEINRLRVTNPEEYTRQMAIESRKDYARQQEVTRQLRADEDRARAARLSNAASTVQGNGQNSMSGDVAGWTHDNSNGNIAGTSANAAAGVDTATQAASRTPAPDSNLKATTSVDAAFTAALRHAPNGSRNGQAPSNPTPPTMPYPPNPSSYRPGSTPSTPLAQITPRLTPTTGASTFFGEPDRVAFEARSENIPPMFRPDFLSTSPQTFSAELSKRLKEVQEHKRFPYVDGDPRRIANNIMHVVRERMRKDGTDSYVQELRWKLLCEHLHEARFVVGLASGFLSVDWLTQVSTADLDARLQTLKILPMTEFRSMIHNFNTTKNDPQNLDNIQRMHADDPTRQGPNREGDLRAMQQAAEARGRWTPNAPLPGWAERALIDARGRYGNGNGEG